MLTCLQLLAIAIAGVDIALRRRQRRFQSELTADFKAVQRLSPDAAQSLLDQNLYIEDQELGVEFSKQRNDYLHSILRAKARGEEFDIPEAFLNYFSRHPLSIKILMAVNAAYLGFSAWRSAFATVDLIVFVGVMVAWYMCAHVVDATLRNDVDAQLRARSASET